MAGAMDRAALAEVFPPDSGEVVPTLVGGIGVSPAEPDVGARDGIGAGTAAAPGRGFRPAFVGLLGAMAALGAVTVDMYLPSLPTVAAELGTSDAAVALTISGVLLGAALGQLLVGPMSDRFGRRRPALVGIALHVVASLLCVLAPTIGMLIALRFLQGVGNAAAGITAMAVIRDRLTGGPAARVISRLMLVIGVAPLFAPTVGGLIAGVAGWRAVFGVLAAFGLALGVAVWRWLPETLPPVRRTTSGVGGALRGYRSLLGGPALPGPRRHPGPDHGGAHQLRRRLAVRAPGRLRPHRPPVRPGLRGQRPRPGGSAPRSTPRSCTAWHPCASCVSHCP